MPQDPFPHPPGDAEEPGCSSLPPAAGGGPDDGWEDWDGPAEQGLYMCLPAGQVTLAGFAQNGEADTMAPGPLLATIVDTVTGEDGKGLAGCSDDQLLGIISGARRMGARAAWTEMAAEAEYAARHSGSRPADEFAPVELGFELHLTPQSAKEQMDFAAMVTQRLPTTFAALAAGRIHPVHLRIIADETLFLSDEDAAKADKVLADLAPGMTFGELRHAAHKLILKLDPETAKKRKEAARGEAHVRRFREHSGNAGMIAHELPSDEVLASWQHIEQRALDLRAAGMPGSLQELRVRAYLDLLQERDSRDLLAAPVGSGDASQASPPDQRERDQHEPEQPDPSRPAPDQPDPSRPAPDQPDPSRPAPDQPDPSRPAPDQPDPAIEPPGSSDSGFEPDGPGSPGDPEGPGNGPGGNGGSGRGPGGPGPAPAPGAGTGPSLAAQVTLTIPWDTWQGRAETAGQADGFGVLDGDDARDLAAAAARHPRTRWCVTALNPDGTAVAHACLPGRDPPPGTGPPHHLLRFTGPLVPVARGPCDHAHAEVGYHPSRKLAHMIRARSATCTAPGCRRPAARCDLDHTHAWDQGGLTCECNLAPLCRHHHRAKQAEGWRLEQPEPGVLIWRTRSGRSYTTTPTTYG